MNRTSRANGSIAGNSATFQYTTRSNGRTGTGRGGHGINPARRAGDYSLRAITRSIHALVLGLSAGIRSFEVKNCPMGDVAFSDGITL